MCRAPSKSFKRNLMRHVCEIFGKCFVNGSYYGIRNAARTKTVLLPESVDVTWIFKCVANFMATKAFVLCACVLIKLELRFWSLCIRVQMNLCQHQQPRKQRARRSQVPSGRIHAYAVKCYNVVLGVVIISTLALTLGYIHPSGAHMDYIDISPIASNVSSHSTDSVNVLECCATAALESADLLSRRGMSWKT